MNLKEFDSREFLNKVSENLTLKNIRSRGYELVSPEYEYVVGAALLITYLTAMIEPSLLPQQLNDALNLVLHYSPIPDTVVFGGASLVSTTTMIDGARRVAAERLPMLKVGAQLTWKDWTDRFG